MAMKLSDRVEYNAALYVRLSKEDDGEGPSQSVSNQLSLLRSYAEEKGLNIYDTYVDDGYSGTTFERPSFQRMIADILEKRVNLVITKDLSRLGRDYIQTGHYMERFFPEHRVRYISLLDGVDTGVESAANDITPFRAIMNDMYAKDISKKIKSVKHDKQRRGLFIGGKAVYGYMLHPSEKNKLAIDGDAAKIVGHIFSMALSGMSCRQIAIALNGEGIPTPAVYAGLTAGRGGPYSGQWRSETVSSMLQNETYIGHMVQGRSKKISYKSKKCARQRPEDWIVVEDTHPPIIAKEDFERVQGLLASRRRTRSRTYDFLLKGLVFCHECGYPLGVVNRKNAAGEDALYLVCRTYQRFTKAGACTCHCIKEETLRMAVLKAVREACGDQVDCAALLIAAEEALAQERGRTGDEGKTLRARLGALTAGLDKMYLDKLEGVLSEGDFDRIYARLRDERGALEERLALLGAGVCQPLGERARELVDRFIQTAGENRELIASLVERVEFTAGREVLLFLNAKSPEGSGSLQ